MYHANNAKDILGWKFRSSESAIIDAAKQIKKLLVITRGDKGAISINGDEINEIGIKKNLNLVDLTGAGDLFAAGYLHGIINNLPSADCLKKGTEMSAWLYQIHI